HGQRLLLDCLTDADAGLGEGMQRDLALLALPGSDDPAVDEDRARDVAARLPGPRKDPDTEPLVGDEQLVVELSEWVLPGKQPDALYRLGRFQRFDIDCEHELRGVDLG